MKLQEYKRFIKENRHFSLLWLSQICSQITINMINFVMATRIFEKTGSTVAVSLLWVFFYLPSIFLGPFSGFFVDLFNRRKLLIVSNFFQMLVIIGYLFIGVKVYPIYTLVFLYSLANQFYFPAEAAMIPTLVKSKDLPLANSLFLLTSQSALAVGFGLGGLFLRFGGINFPVIFTAFCLLAATIAVYFLPKTKIATKKPEDFTQFWQGIKDGYGFILTRPVIIYPMLICVCLQILLVVVGVTLPELASKIINIRIADAGPLLVFPLGVGALIGVNLISRFIPNQRKKLLVSIGLTLITVVLLSFAFVIGNLGSYRLWLTIPLMILLGISIVFVFIPNQILIQKNTPSNYLGRVFGALGFIGNLATLPFLLFLATIVELLGLKAFLLLVAVILIFFLLILHKLEIYLMKGLFNRITG